MHSCVFVYLTYAYTMYPYKQQRKDAECVYMI